MRKHDAEQVNKYIQSLTAELSRLREELESERWRTWDELPSDGQRIRLGFKWDNEVPMKYTSFEEDHFVFRSPDLFQELSRDIMDFDERKIFNLSQIKKKYTHWRPAAKPPEVG